MYANVEIHLKCHKNCEKNEIQIRLSQKSINTSILCKYLNHSSEISQTTYWYICTRICRLCAFMDSQLYSICYFNLWTVRNWWLWRKTFEAKCPPYIFSLFQILTYTGLFIAVIYFSIITLLLNEKCGLIYLLLEYPVFIAEKVSNCNSHRLSSFCNILRVVYK